MTAAVLLLLLRSVILPVKAVIMMTGMFLSFGSCLICRHTSKPFIPGMIMSRSTRSIAWLLIFSKASFPLAALTTT